MAGHSKWANIKHKKERVDAQKGKIFSRMVKEIISAVKSGGPDPKANARLRLAIQKARDSNVPNDNIERNIKKASSPDQADYVPVTYEIYGHAGVGMIIEALTDNKNRTASEMRIATNKRGGSIATPGAVSFNFDRKGVIEVEKDKMNQEELLNAAIEAGAEDLEIAEEGWMITTDPTLLYEVKEALEGQEIKVLEAGIEMIPKTLIACEDEAQKANFALIEWLEGIEDVDEVYHNMDI